MTACSCTLALDGGLPLGERVYADGHLYEVVGGAQEDGQATHVVRELSGFRERTIAPPDPEGRQAYVDRSSIHRLVHAFYAKVRDDAELGPVFEARLDGQWGPHLDKMVRFWRTVLLAEGTYEGNPMAAHRALLDAQPAHFERWLVLFDETLRDVYDDACAEDVSIRARSMARGLSRGMFGRPFDGGPVAPYPRPRS